MKSIAAITASLCAIGCSFSPSTSGSLIDCSDGKACPEGWHCPTEGKQVCVEGVAPDTGASVPLDGGIAAEDRGGGLTDAETADVPADPDASDVADAASTSDRSDPADAPDTSDAGAEDSGQSGDGGCNGCTSPPASSCEDSNTLSYFESPGTCSSDVCLYASATKECYYGCANGSCVDCTPDCAGKDCGDDGCGESCGDCDSPPADSCLNASTVRDYALSGTCAGGACQYTYTDRPCQYGCAGGACKGCQPSCAGKECGGDGCGGSCGGCSPASDCTRGACQNDACVQVPANEGSYCGGQGECYKCKSGSCSCNTPHYECPSCLPSCGVLGGACCPSTMQCDAAGEKGASNDCDQCCAGQCT